MTILVEISMKHASPGQALEVRQVFDDGSLFDSQVIRAGEVREVLVYDPLHVSFHPAKLEELPCVSLD